MSNALEVCREIFPDLPDEALDSIIWERTGYPSFFDPKEGETAEDVFRRQLISFKEALKTIKHSNMCTLCNDEAEKGTGMCERHRLIMKDLREKSDE